MSFKRQNCLKIDPAGDSQARRYRVVPRVARFDEDRVKKFVLHIGNIPRTFLIDTGAAVSMIKSKVVHDHGMVIDAAEEVIVDVSGNALNREGVTFIQLDTGSVKLTHRFFVCPDELCFSTDGLIDADFLDEHGAIVDFANKIISVRNNSLPLSNLNEVGDPSHKPTHTPQNNNPPASEGEREVRVSVKNKDKDFIVRILERITIPARHTVVCVGHVSNKIRKDHTC